MQKATDEEKHVKILREGVELASAERTSYHDFTFYN